MLQATERVKGERELSVAHSAGTSWQPFNCPAHKQLPTSPFQYTELCSWHELRPRSTMVAALAFGATASARQGCLHWFESKTLGFLVVKWWVQGCPAVGLLACSAGTCILTVLWLQVFVEAHEDLHSTSSISASRKSIDADSLPCVPYKLSQISVHPSKLKVATS